MLQLQDTRIPLHGNSALLRRFSNALQVLKSAFTPIKNIKPISAHWVPVNFISLATSCLRLRRKSHKRFVMCPTWAFHIADRVLIGR